MSEKKIPETMETTRENEVSVTDSDGKMQDNESLIAEEEEAIRDNEAMIAEEEDAIRDNETFAAEPEEPAPENENMTRKAIINIAKLIITVFIIIGAIYLLRAYTMFIRP